MASIKGWKIQTEDKNLIRYVNTNIRTYPVQIVNAKFNYKNPHEGWAVGYKKNNFRQFKTKAKALKFAKYWMKKHPRG